MFNFSPNFHPNVFLQLIYVLLIYMIFVQILYYSFQTTFLPLVLFDSHNFPLKSEVGFVEFILQLRELVSREAVLMAQLVTGRAQTWPSVLLPGQQRFCFSALFMEYQLFSDSFILALASSWVYHFLFTWYQKPQCKYLVIGHLVLEINQWQSQEAWAYFPAYGKATHLWRTQGGPLWIKSHHPSPSQAPSSESRMSEMTGAEIPGRGKQPTKKFHWEQLPLTLPCPSILAAGIFSWRWLNSMATKRLPSEVLH